LSSFNLFKICVQIWSYVNHFSIREPSDVTWIPEARTTKKLPGGNGAMAGPAW